MEKEQQKPEPPKYKKRVVIDILPSGEIVTHFKQAEGQTMLTKPEVNRLKTALDVGWSKQYQQYRLNLALPKKDVTNAS
jgi:hypothetical protein